MKKYLSILAKTFAFLFLSILFSGCLKDTCKHTYTYTFYEPIYKTTAEVRANIKSNPAKEIKEPGKIVIIGNYIFLNEVNKFILPVIWSVAPESNIHLEFFEVKDKLETQIIPEVFLAFSCF